MNRIFSEPIATWTNSLLFIGISLVVFIIGIGSAIAPIYLAIFSMMPLFVILACWQFRIAVLVMLLFASGLIPNSFTPAIPFLGGTIRTEDMFLGFLIVIGTIRLLAQTNKIENHALWYPFYFFIFLVIFSLLIAKGHHNKPRWMMFEFRLQLYWFYAPLLVMCIKEEKHLNAALNFVIFLSTILAIAVIFQSLTGIRILNHGMLSPLVTVTDINRDVNRSTFGGFQAFVVFTFILTLARLSRHEMSPLLAFPVLLLIALGLIVSFGRGVWAVSFVITFIASIWLGKNSFIKIWTVLLTVGTVIILTSVLLKPQLADAVFSRLMSVSHELEEGESWEWRMMEQEWALRTIQKHPISGIGLGGEYSPLRDRTKDPEQMIMTHNSYLYIALKFGLFGLLFPLWLCLAVLRKAKQLNTTLSISLACAFLNPVLIGYTQMEWVSIYGILSMATMVGLLVTHDRFQRNCRSSLCLEK